MVKLNKNLEDKNNMDLEITKSIDADLQNKLLKEQNLIKSDIKELLSDVEPINPLFYYHRLLVNLYPDSDFSKNINDDLTNVNRTIMSYRNKLIEESIKENIRSNSMELFPGIVYTDIKNTLTRNDEGHGIASTGITREICFLIALTFNLTYEQTEDLLMHCIGETDFNYKNPYEVMLVYCLKEHIAVYESFCALKENYENAKHNISDKELLTKNYKNLFSKIKNKDELVEFLSKLPNTDSKSARREFSKLYDELVEINKDFSMIDMAADGEADIFYGDECELLNCATYDYSNDIIKRIFGEKLRKKGNFKFVKKHCFTKQELLDKLEGRKNISKQDIVVLYFYKYIESGDWADCIDILEEKRQKYPQNDLNILGNIYDDFRMNCNSILEKAGFSSLYLPNSFERTIVFCLMTEDPILTLRKIVMS